MTEYWVTSERYDRILNNIRDVTEYWITFEICDRILNNIFIENVFGK